VPRGICETSGCVRYVLSSDPGLIKIWKKKGKLRMKKSPLLTFSTCCVLRWCFPLKKKTSFDPLHPPRVPSLVLSKKKKSAAPSFGPSVGVSAGASASGSSGASHGYSHNCFFFFYLARAFPLVHWAYNTLQRE
jgi:hypothetical protein